MRSFSLWVEKLMFLCIAIFFGVIAIIAQTNVSDGTYPFKGERIFFVCYSLFEYITKGLFPINLNYTLAILASNTADMDELCRELIFKYTSMYFLAIDTPYESKRRIRFGIRIDLSDTIDRISSQGEYMRNGQLYQTNIPLVCDGAVLLTYTPAHLKRINYEVEAYAVGQVDLAVARDRAVEDL